MTRFRYLGLALAAAATMAAYVLGCSAMIVQFGGYDEIKAKITSR